MFSWISLNCKSVQKEEIIVSKNEFIETCLPTFKDMLKTKKTGFALKCDVRNYKRYVFFDSLHTDDNHEIFVLIQVDDLISVMDEYSDRQFIIQDKWEYLYVNYVFGLNKK